MYAKRPERNFGRTARESLLCCYSLSIKNNNNNNNNLPGLAYIFFSFFFSLFCFYDEKKRKITLKNTASSSLVV
jgi:hypothetical protein